jgi:hypothetical protein
VGAAEVMVVMNVYGKMEVLFLTCLTGAQDGGDWLVFCPCHSTLRVGAIGNHCVGGSLGPRAHVEVFEERKYSYPP